ncbi:Uma2 family endonuclease [Planktothrix agardhii]|uniref:Uma2 family endonuclease n=1 Tax=Planktothrix agardhii TaxID=1160 RepID=UPI001F41D141|nr:Uma2 family endonuclease [Planktothrix agardhii]MCF3645440.1 Uma2 family endonuclease [Planktothrix agardhii 1026]
MSIQVLKRYFTVEDYQKMGEVGVFKADENNELVAGEIIKMSPIGKRHAACVNRCNHLFYQILGDQILISVQNPIQLNNLSQPQPDLVLLQPRPDFYEERHPQPSDIILLIEVSDTTIDFDQQVKIPLYCQSDIQEVWLIDLNQNIVRVYRTPTANGYQSIQFFTVEQTLTLAAFPEFNININQIFC